MVVVEGMEGSLWQYLWAATTNVVFAWSIRTEASTVRDQTITKLKEKRGWLWVSYTALELF